MDDAGFPLVIQFWKLLASNKTNYQNLGVRLQFITVKNFNSEGFRLKLKVHYKFSALPSIP